MMILPGFPFPSGGAVSEKIVAVVNGVRGAEDKLFFTVPEEAAPGDLILIVAGGIASRTIASTSDSFTTQYHANDSTYGSLTILSLVHAGQSEFWIKENQITGHGGILLVAKATNIYISTGSFGQALGSVTVGIAAGGLSDPGEYVSVLMIHDGGATTVNPSDSEFIGYFSSLRVYRHPTFRGTAQYGLIDTYYRGIGFVVD